MTDRITKTDELFVLAHVGIPVIDSADWHLELTGLIRSPGFLNFASLKRLPKIEIESFHQCAGDPTNPKSPKRRVANVVWGGADLAHLLDRVGVLDTATHLWSYGPDYGEYEGDQYDYYLKDMPLGRLKEGDVMIAYEVNGESLTREHGYPARLVIPGYYGTNSVKWLCRIELTDRRAEGPFTTRYYNDEPGVDREGNPTPSRPVWVVPVEAVIVSPAPGAAFDVGRTIEISGWAWADAGVGCVELSDDDGRTWWDARLQGRTGRSWQRFESDWTPAASCCDGDKVSLRARATSNDGTVQPAEAARNCVHSVDVKIVGPAPADRI
jgi:DMSO/TMAO reductase YedYZ molybdopterin-dependent catalytic subunit